jgi:hypothetical protein
MRLLFHTPSKRGVTRVTGVAYIYNSLIINELFKVTRRRGRHGATCYEAESCNNTALATPLLARTLVLPNRCTYDTSRGQGAVDGQ